MPSRKKGPTFFERGFWVLQFEPAVDYGLPTLKPFLDRFPLYKSAKGKVMILMHETSPLAAIEYEVIKQSYDGRTWYELRVNRQNFSSELAAAGPGKMDLLQKFLAVKGDMPPLIALIKRAIECSEHDLMIGQAVRKTHFEERLNFPLNRIKRFMSPKIAEPLADMPKIGYSLPVHTVVPRRFIRRPR